MSNTVEQDLWRHSEKPRKELPAGVDIFVPKDQESAYFAEHGIEIRKLPNGATLAGATRRVEDAAIASMKITFPTAPYYDPPEKRGLSHLMEHLIGYRPLYASFANEAAFNATTTPSDIHLELEGRAHPDVRDYGVWPVLPIALDQVTQPLRVTDDELRREKGIVTDEIHQRLDGLGLEWKDHSLLSRTLFTPSYPDFYLAVGTGAEVSSLSVSDVEEAHRSMFIPRGLQANVFTEGKPEINASLLDELEDKIGKMPDTGKNPKRLDDNLFEVMNPDYNQGDIYFEHTRKPTEPGGRQQLHYAWLLPNENFTPQSFAQYRFMQVAFERLFQNVREAGIAYTVSPLNKPIGEDKIVLGFTIDIMKQDDPVLFAKQIYSHLGPKAFGSFDEADMAEIDRTTHKRAASSPVTVRERFTDALMGLGEYGGVIDTDKKNAIHNRITPAHLREAQAQITSTAPTIIIEGDLSK